MALRALRNAPDKLIQVNCVPGSPPKSSIILKAGNYEITAGKPPASKAKYWAGGGALEITDDLTIVGKGAALSALRMLAVTSTARERFLEIAPNINVEVDGVGFGVGGWGGRAPYGGAIYSNGRLTLRNCYVAHGTADVSGGGIFNRGQLTAIGTVFQYNIAARDGGAVFNDVFAVATITSSTLRNNSAGDASQTHGGHGGGVFNMYLGNTTIRNSTVSSNHAAGTSRWSSAHVARPRGSGPGTRGRRPARRISRFVPGCT
jgi:hypothetical protein